MRELSTRDLLYRARLGVPRVTLALVATTLLVSLAVAIVGRRLYMTLGVAYCEENAPVHWWHGPILPFIHGTGCPFPAFPPFAFHLGLIVVQFVLLGMLVERVLGAGRTALLTLTNLAVHIVLVRVIVDGYCYGGCGMTWSYVVFSMQWLYVAFRAQRWRMFRDWTSVAVSVLTLLSLIGLVKHWHLWSLLVSLPFFFAWRKTFVANLSAIGEGRAPDRGKPRQNAIGIAVALAVCAYNLAFLVAALLGWIPLVSLGTH